MVSSHWNRKPTYLSRRSVNTWMTWRMLYLPTWPVLRATGSKWVPKMFIFYQQHNIDQHLWPTSFTRLLLSLKWCVYLNLEAGNFEVINQIVLKSVPGCARVPVQLSGPTEGRGPTADQPEWPWSWRSSRGFETVWLVTESYCPQLWVGSGSRNFLSRVWLIL